MTNARRSAQIQLGKLHLNLGNYERAFRHFNQDGSDHSANHNHVASVDDAADSGMPVRTITSQPRSLLARRLGRERSVGQSTFTPCTNSVRIRAEELDFAKNFALGLFRIGEREKAAEAFAEAIKIMEDHPCGAEVSTGKREEKRNNNKNKSRKNRKEKMKTWASRMSSEGR